MVPLYICSTVGRDTVDGHFRRHGYRSQDVPQTELVYSTPTLNIGPTYILPLTPDSVYASGCCIYIVWRDEKGYFLFYVVWRLTCHHEANQEKNRGACIWALMSTALSMLFCTRIKQHVGLRNIFVETQFVHVYQHHYYPSRQI